MSDEVRERVLAAAEELEYRPNELARSMNTGKSNTIGVVVGDIENPPHFGLAMRGITDTAKKSGYNVILINTDEERAAEVDAVRVLLDKRVDGLIVAPASSVETSHLQQVRESGRPLVLLDRAAAGGVDVETFAVDMGSISYESTKHLIEAGHRRIAFVSTVRTEAPMLQGWSWTLRRSQTAWTESTVRSMKRASPIPLTSSGLMQGTPTPSCGSRRTC